MKLIRILLPLLIILQASIFAYSQPTWIVNPNDYEYNMTVTCVVSLSDTLVENTAGVIVGAFNSSDVCVGKATALYYNNIKKFRNPLIIYSNENNVEIHFKAYIPNYNYEFEIETNINFSIDGSIGNFANPQVMNLKAYTTSWTGASDSNWGNEDNWDITLPNKQIDVVIPVTMNQPIIENATCANCKNLTIESNAIVQVESGSSLFFHGEITYDGEIRIKRMVGANQWVAFSPPNNTTSLHNFLGDYVMTWSETEGSWNYLETATDVLIPGNGYFIWTENSEKEVVLSGLPAQGEQSIDISYTNIENELYKGANFIGNPYTSYIDWSLLDAEKFGAIYYWTGTKYASWNNGLSNNGGVQFVAPMQGFFVVINQSVVNENNGKLTLTSAHRSDTITNSFFKNADSIPVNSLRLAVKNDVVADDLIIHFNENSNSSFDQSFDAYKFSNVSSGGFDLYSINKSDHFSIDVRPDTNYIQLGFNGVEESEFTFELIESTMGKPIYLEDKLTSKITEITNETYSFSSNQNLINNRFALLFEKLNRPVIEEKQPVFVEYKNGNLSIETESNKENMTLAIIDLSGKILIRETVKLLPKVEVPIALSQGVYLVRLYGEMFDSTQKIIVR